MYRAWPRLTAISTVVFAGIVGTVIYVGEQPAKVEREAKLLQSQSYAAQPNVGYAQELSITCGNFREQRKA